MPLLITIVTGDLAQVPIFPTRWPVAAPITIILSRDLGHVDSSGRGRVLSSGAAKAAIATICIAPILLVVPARFFRGFSSLWTIKKHSLCLLGVERMRTSVPGVFFARFWGGALALGTISIHLTDPQRRFRAVLASAVITFLIAWSEVSFWQFFCLA